MVGLCLAYFLIILDAGVLNLALPTIRAGLAASMSGAQWVLDGYTLPLAALLLSSGRAGDRWGHRRVLVTGLVVFVVASAGCALAPGIVWLNTWRAVQGVGAAIVLPATLSLIPHLYADQHGRGRATVRWVGTGALAMAVAPLAGGALIAALGWRGIFAVNLPLGLFALWLVRANVIETPRGDDVSIDLWGQLLVVAGLGLLATGAILSGSDGWASRSVGGCLCAAVLLLAAFGWSQRRGRAPLIPARILQDPLRTAAIASAGAMGFVFYGTLLGLSITLQTVRGWSALHAGLGLLPMTAASTVGPLLAYHRLARRHSPSRILVAGFATVALGAAALAITGGRGYPWLLPTMLLIGGASTICFPALTSMLITRTPTSDSGLASALQNTSRQTGALLAYAVVGSVLTQHAVERVPVVAAILVGLTAAAIATVLIGRRCAAREWQVRL
jgi:MFS transporter, DHA2 family, methylenomycin A resistance protein